MGYTTYFTGQFDVTPTLKPEHIAYLNAFCETRRMKRDAEKAALLPDPVREAAGLPIGPEGGYFVGNTENMGQNDDPSVIDHNEPPGMPAMEPAPGPDPMANFNERFNRFSNAQDEARANGAQPGLWCQWVPTEDGTAIVWDEGEKFYNYVEWIKYLLNNFLKPWGYTLNGEVDWSGEENGDLGKIKIVNNEVVVLNAVITYE